MTSGCKSPPVYDECLISVYTDVNGAVVDCVADCIKLDKTLYEKKCAELDGMYAYTAEHRSNILKWAKVNCSK